MKSRNTLFSTSLLIATTLATSSEHGSNLADRLARRAAKGGSRPMIPVGPKFPIDVSNSNATAEQYSGNWAGAVQTAPPAGTTYSAVSASFTVPEPNLPDGATGGLYAASAWAGIDGDTYGAAILQAGCDFSADTNGAKTYDCWYEWFPNPLTDFDNFGVSAGDVISINLASSSPSAGTATLKNEKTGQTAVQDLTAPNPTATLGGQNAEWIVEDFSSGSGLVPFANFGSVTLNNCVATAGSGTVGTNGATILDIEQNGKVLTKTTVVDGSTVRVDYQ